MMLMHFLRKSALASAAIMFVTVLSLFGVLWGFDRVFGTPTSLKHALKASGTYDHVVSNALDQAQKEDSNSSNKEDIPVNNADVRKIISQAFPPQYLQSQTEQAIDAFYNWMHGSTPTLVFRLDLSEAKTKLADGVGTYVSQRLSTLPVCTPATIPSGDVDPFNATCVPPGFDVAAAAERARQEILTSNFLKDAQFDAADLKTQNGKPFTETYHQVPTIYRAATNTLYGLGIFALLLGVAMVFLSRDRRSGLRKLGILSLCSGIVVTILGWGVNILTHRATTDFAARAESKEPLQQNAIKIVQLLAADIHNWWLGFGLTLVALSVGGLLALHFTKPKQVSKTGDKAQLPAGDDAIRAKPEQATDDTGTKATGENQKDRVKIRGQKEN